MFRPFIKILIITKSFFKCFSKSSWSKMQRAKLTRRKIASVRLHSTQHKHTVNPAVAVGKDTDVFYWMIRFCVCAVFTVRDQLDRQTDTRRDKYTLSNPRNKDSHQAAFNPRLEKCCIVLQCSFAQSGSAKGKIMFEKECM